jgi:hypothetical protein
MSALAPTLESFFTVRLASQRNASPNTVAAYRDAFRLLLTFVHEPKGLHRRSSPSRISMPPSSVPSWTTSSHIAT